MLERSPGGIVVRAASLVLAGAVGAGIALGVAAAVDSGATTTVVERASEPSAGQTDSATQPASERFTSTTGALAAVGAIDVRNIYREAGPGVVQVSSLAPGANASAPGTPLGQGSGFVIDKGGHIVTNFHVIDGAGEVLVSFSGGDRVTASVVGVDPSTDLAVLEVEMPPSALTPLPLGDSNAVAVGDPVVAIGNPFGLERTVTAGIVSAIQREIRAPNGLPIDHVIQTDAQINRGNSGGPLLNADGEVIGVNAQIETGGSGFGNIGIGFAVPVNTVRDVAAQLIETGKVERAFLGIEMQTIDAEAADAFGLPVDAGVLIATVRPGSPAARAGLRGGGASAVINGETWVLGGDVVIEADGAPIESSDQLRDVVLAKKPGDSLSLEVNRDGRTLTIRVELGRQPTTPTG